MPAPCDSTGRNGPKDRGLGAAVIDWVRDAVTGAAPGIHPIPNRSDQVVLMQYSVSDFSPVTPGVPSGFSVAGVFLDAGA
jgi:hypothetical protein